MSSEVELKLSLDRKYTSRLRKQLSIIYPNISKPITHKLINIYFDTPDFKLWGAGITLRLRRKSKTWIQTIKLAGSVSAGLHVRPELENIVATNHPDFTKIQDRSLIKFFSDQKLRHSIIPIFQTKVQRNEWQLSFNNGDKVELALDSGLLYCNQNQEPINEIELELKAGSASRLFDIALAIQNEIPLKLENASKAQRGYAFLQPQPSEVFKANMPILDKNMDANTAFRLIVQECIAHLQNNQDAVINASDAEGVHQMRVALRRLRSALTLFKKILLPDCRKFLLNELNWLTKSLGKARDLDVFITQTLPSIAGYFEKHQGLLTLEKKALKAKLNAYKDISETLASQRYQRMLLTLSSWVENEIWHKNSKNYQIETIAVAALNKFHKRLMNHRGNFANMRPEERHVVRIADKKLRYAAEFFASLYPAKSTRKYIKLLTELQDNLGLINDINVTFDLIKTLSGPKPSVKTKEAIQIFEEWNKNLLIQNTIRIDKVWGNMLTIKPFWI